MSGASGCLAFVFILVFLILLFRTLTLNRRHLVWLVLGSERRLRLVQVGSGSSLRRQRRHADLLGREIDLVSLLENVLVSSRVESHITYVSANVHRQLNTPQCKCCSVTTASFQLLRLLTDILDNLMTQLRGETCHCSSQRYFV